MDIPEVEDNLDEVLPSVASGTGVRARPIKKRIAGFGAPRGWESEELTRLSVERRNSMTKTIDIVEAEKDLRGMIRSLESGSEIIIAERDKPLALVLPIGGRGKKKIAGLSEGKIWMSDDFNDPLPDDFWLGNE